MNNNIKLDQKRLISDLYVAKNYLCYKSGLRDIKQDINGFFTLNNTLCEIYGYNFDKNEITNMHPNVEKKVKKMYNLFRQYFYHYYLNNIDLINETGANYNNMLYDIDIVCFPFFDQLKKYNEKDFKDIILSFYNSINEDYYKITKKYFDEKRISMGEIYQQGIGGYYASMSLSDTGYIFMPDEELNSLTASFLVHELGHAIDAETFLFPQQKNFGVLEDTLLELPSTCFENMFHQYLINNKIDETGGLILDNERILNTDGYFGDIEECSYTSPLYIDENGNVESEDKLINFRDALLYGVGYYFTFHLYEIYKNDPKEFNKIFYNIISSRKECNLEDIINKMNITSDEFSSSKLIKDTIEENTKKLKKRFNYMNNN